MPRLNTRPSDRYQYILPYYKIVWDIDQNYIPGFFDFSSYGANDLNETLAIKSLMNDYAYEVNISSTKSMTGHLLGGGGAFEAMASLLSMKNSLIPPTINLNDSDEDCDLNYTANHSIEKNIDHAMSNSFGFGGHNAVLIFSKQ